MMPNRYRGSLWAFVFCVLTMLGLSPASAHSTMVRLYTTQGPIDLQLYDADTPMTVANFLGYVRRGDYADTFIHRSVANFVIQTGGYAFPPSGYTGIKDGKVWYLVPTVSQDIGLLGELGDWLNQATQAGY